MPAETLLLMEHLATTPVTATYIKNWTNRDPVLAKVKQFVASGWPERNAEKDLQPYFQRRNKYRRGVPTVGELGDHTTSGKDASCGRAT